MRTPEVEKAISNTKAGMYCTDDADTLADEVERLEAGLVKANEAARAAMYAIDERAFLAECAEKSEKRAESAEARVAELEAQIAEVVGSQRNEDKSLPTWAQVMNRVALLTEQNARLRAALVKLRAAAHHAEIWLTSCLDCKDWMWSEHQHEAATEARDELKAALNAEEAST